MCGVAGIFPYSDPGRLDLDELRAIREELAHRGPDGAGFWIDQGRRIALGHTRLAIIDLTSSGAQPMISADGQLAITYNGEIYNYLELKQELRGLGHRFRTNSDTEVLLALYSQFGDEMLHRLRGMYAFALWDGRNQRLFAARDPFGIKPFYYADDGRVLRFASQVKALAKGNGIRLTPNPAGHVGFFMFGHVPEPHTLYREIRALPAGSTLEVSPGRKPQVKRFYDLAKRFAEAEGGAPGASSEAEQLELVRAAVHDSVKHHLVADVPVGVFLSSGVDSNVIAAAATASGQRVAGITMGFREYEGTSNDEVPLASRQANALGIPHHVDYVSKADFYERMESIWSAMDQPSIDGVNSWLVARVASKFGLKVCLSGLGGDELFGGYPSFRQIPKLVRFASDSRIPRAAKASWPYLAMALRSRWVSPKYAALFSLGGTRHGAYLLRRCLYIEPELPRFLDPDVAAEGMQELGLDESLAASCSGIRSDHAAIAAMELSWYMRNQLLRDTDWASMAHGVEVRTPFVDTRFIDALLPALTSSKPPNKRVLATSAGPILLREIVERPKTGFITPVAGWVKAKYGGKRRGLRRWARMTYSRFVRETSVSRPDAILPRPSDAPPVLVFRIGQLGDAAVSLPALAALRRQAPDAPLVLLTNQWSRGASSVSAWDVIGPAGACDATIFYDASRQGLANWNVQLKLARSIRRLAPREVVNLAPRNRLLDVLRDRFFFRMVCGVSGYRALPVDATKPSSQAQPEWLRLLQFISPGAEDSRFSLAIPRWAASQAEAELAPLRGNQHLIAFAPGSQMPAKRWPANRYVEVGRQLLARDDRTALVIVGGGEDYPLGEQLRDAWGARSLNLCGRLCVFGSAAVLNRCEAFVGNDSGAMHLAGLVGTPCVALFSARDAAGKWQPFGKSHRVLRKEVPCSGCMLTVCDKDNLCLSKISVEEVVTAFEGVAVYQVH